MGYPKTTTVSSKRIPSNFLGNSQAWGSANIENNSKASQPKRQNGVAQRHPSIKIVQKIGRFAGVGTFSVGERRIG